MVSERLKLKNPEEIPFDEINFFESKHYYGIRESADGIFLTIPRRYDGKDLDNTFLFQAEDTTDLNLQLMERTHEEILHVSKARKVTIAVVNANE